MHDIMTVTIIWTKGRDLFSQMPGTDGCIWHDIHTASRMQHDMHSSYVAGHMILA